MQRCTWSPSKEFSAIQSAVTGFLPSKPVNGHAQEFVKKSRAHLCLINHETAVLACLEHLHWTGALQGRPLEEDFVPTYMHTRLYMPARVLICTDVAAAVLGQAFLTVEGLHLHRV